MYIHMSGWPYASKMLDFLMWIYFLQSLAVKSQYKTSKYVLSLKKYTVGRY